MRLSTRLISHIELTQTMDALRKNGWFAVLELVQFKKLVSYSEIPPAERTTD